MENNYPWTNDSSNRPILDTPEKLIAYTSAILHEPAELRFINFSPLDLESVTLYYGQSKQQRQAALKKALNRMKNASLKDYNPLDSLPDLAGFETMVPLGTVNGIAADTINRLKNQDSL